MAWMRPFGVGLVVLLVLDFIWLGLLMSGFYRRGLGQIARTAADGSLSPLWAAAVPVYLLIVAGLLVFAVSRPEASSSGGALRSGALFGLITYGVYDFTNLSTHRRLPAPARPRRYGVGSDVVRTDRRGDAVGSVGFKAQGSGLRAHGSSKIFE